MKMLPAKVRLPLLEATKRVKQLDRFIEYVQQIKNPVSEIREVDPEFFKQVDEVLRKAKNERKAIESAIENAMIEFEVGHEEDESS